MSKKEVPVSRFDERLVKRYLATKEMSQKDYEQYLKSLPDDKDNATYTVIEDDHEQNDE